MVAPSGGKVTSDRVSNATVPPKRRYNVPSLVTLKESTLYRLLGGTVTFEHGQMSQFPLTGGTTCPLGSGDNVRILCERVI